MKEIDVRSLACPGPVIELRKLLDSGEPVIRMLVGDELARSNVTRFATSRGADVGVEPTRDGGFAVTVAAGNGACEPAVHEEAAVVYEPLAAGPVVVQVTSSTMGHGDDELGALLMRSFLKTQLQLHRLPDVITFYNSGVHLCCVGSPLLDDLLALEESGVEIIACGTCLSFFELADALRVGRVCDMLEIAGRLAGAGRLVRP